MDINQEAAVAAAEELAGQYGADTMAVKSATSQEEQVNTAVQRCWNGSVRWMCWSTTPASCPEGLVEYTWLTGTKSSASTLLGVCSSAR